MTKKTKLISCGIIFLLSAFLIILSLMFEGDYGYLVEEEIFTLNLIFYLVAAFALIAGVVFNCLYINLKNTVFFIIHLITSAGLIPIGTMSLVFFSGIRGIILFVGCLVGAGGYYFILFAKIVVIVFIKGFKGLFNIGYTGSKPVKYYRKVVEVFLQFALLPISAFIAICAAYFFICGHLLGGLIVQKLFYDKIKANSKLGYWYYKKGGYVSSGGYYKTRTFEIKDNYGDVIGTIETNGDYVEEESYYEEAKWCYNDNYEKPILHAFIALPCRIISIVLSIVALFVPTLYVSALTPACFKDKEFFDKSKIKPETGKRYPAFFYKGVPFLYFDLLIMNNEITE